MNAPEITIYQTRANVHALRNPNIAVFIVNLVWAPVAFCTTVHNSAGLIPAKVRHCNFGTIPGDRNSP
jgi:hypothetical protein